MKEVRFEDGVFLKKPFIQRIPEKSVTEKRLRMMFKLIFFLFIVVAFGVFLSFLHSNGLHAYMPLTMGISGMLMVLSMN